MSKEEIDDFDDDLDDKDEDQHANPANNIHNDEFPSAFGASFGHQGMGSMGMGMPNHSSLGGLSFGGLSGMGGFGGPNSFGSSFGSGLDKMGSGRRGMGFGLSDFHTPQHSNNLDENFGGFGTKPTKKTDQYDESEKPEKKGNEQSEEQKLARLTKKLDIPEAQQVTLVDWAIRGSAQVIRMVFEYILVPYKERKYVFLTKDQWYNQDQAKLLEKHPCIQLPYLEDGDKIICGTEAIVVYILHKYNRTELLGLCPQDKVRLATLSSIYWDLIEDYYVLCYGQYEEDMIWQKIKDKYFNQKFRSHLNKIVTFAKHKDFQCSTEFLWIDLAIAEIVSILNQMDLNFKEHSPQIQNFVSRVFALPQFIVYRRSGRFHERPYNGMGAIYK